MAPGSELRSGIYTIQNVEFMNHAVLYDDDDPNRVFSDVLPDPPKPGYKWNIRALSNSLYAIQNTDFEHFIYMDPLTTASDSRPVSASSQENKKSYRAWMIANVESDRYVICDLQVTACWELTCGDLNSPLNLGPYSPCSQRQQWILKRDDASSQDIDPQLANGKPMVLSLDGSGIHGIASILVLQELMQLLSYDRERPLAPHDVFDLVGGASSGGLIALLLGRLGVNCAIAWRECANLLMHLSPISNSDLSSHDSDFRARLAEVFIRYSGERRPLMIQSPLKRENSRYSTTKAFVTTMGASRGHSQVACLRSYEDPSGRPDTLTNHEWSILDAAMATCARHPYSAPQQIYDDTDHSTLTCRDPALMGYSNPIHLATAEAHSLFEEKEAVYISIGSGRVCSSEIDQTRVRSKLECRVASLFDAVATAEAAEIHASVKNTLADNHYFRLTPTLDLDPDQLFNPVAIERATQNWLQSRQGKSQLMHIGETILGVPILHLPPPRRLDTLKFNSALDEERPDDLVHFFRQYHVVFLIDDASTVTGKLWSDVQNALRGIVRNTDGRKASAFSIQFVRASRRADDVVDEVSILNAFAGIVPSDRVPISPRLEEVFDEWLEKLNTVVGTLQYSNIKPLHVAVLTAGDIPDSPEQVLRDVSTQIAEHKHHPNVIKLQFIVLESAQNALNSGNMNTLRQSDPAHIVDVTPTFGELNAIRLERCLLRALQPNVQAKIGTSSIPDYGNLHDEHLPTGFPGPSDVPPIPTPDMPNSPPHVLPPRKAPGSVSAPR